MLYDLTTDRGEKNNLAPKHPKVVNELSQKVMAWHESMPLITGHKWQLMREKIVPQKKYLIIRQ